MSKSLTEQNFKDTANLLLVEVAVIKAVAEVESRGDGFFTDGRPKILFEAHIFGSQTKYKYNDTHPNISCKKWDKKLYKGGIKEYDRLNEAIKLDKDAALKSTSWGKFQVMGFNHKICGWDTVQSFVNDMYKDENEHLKAFIGFIRYNKLEKYLQSKEWAKFAKAYNGPAYAQNKYDIKMEKAYEKYKKQLVIETPIVEKPKEDDIPSDDPTINFGGGKFDGTGVTGDY